MAEEDFAHFLALVARLAVEISCAVVGNQTHAQAPACCASHSSVRSASGAPPDDDAIPHALAISAGKPLSLRAWER